MLLNQEEAWEAVECEKRIADSCEKADPDNGVIFGEQCTFPVKVLRYPKELSQVIPGDEIPIQDDYTQDATGYLRRNIFDTLFKLGFLTNKFAVNFGCRLVDKNFWGDWYDLAGALFLYRRWGGLCFDLYPWPAGLLQNVSFHQIHLTPDNVANYLEKNVTIPNDFDLLKIDIDSWECQLMRSILAGGFRPKIIHVEHMSRATIRNMIIETNKGCSCQAVISLGMEFGYELITAFAIDVTMVRGDIWRSSLYRRYFHRAPDPTVACSPSCGCAWCRGKHECISWAKLASDDTAISNELAMRKMAYTFAKEHDNTFQGNFSNTKTTLKIRVLAGSVTEL